MEGVSERRPAGDHGPPGDLHPAGGPGPPLPDLLRDGGVRPPLWRRALYLAGALACVAAGVVGWLVPVVTGLPFYALALVLAALASRRARRWINAAERRLPEPRRRALRRALARLGGNRFRGVVNLPDPCDGA
jgi:hypothetical protein